VRQQVIRQAAGERFSWNVSIFSKVFVWRGLHFSTEHSKSFKFRAFIHGEKDLMQERAWKKKSWRKGQENLSFVFQCERESLQGVHVQAEKKGKLGGAKDQSSVMSKGTGGGRWRWKQKIIERTEREKTENWARGHHAMCFYLGLRILEKLEVQGTRGKHTGRTQEGGP